MKKILMGAALALFSLATSAQGWTPDKTKPVTVVSGFGAGGTTHLVATWFEKHLQANGQPAIVEVKPGAKGQIATAHFTQVSPDGQSVLVVLGLGMMVHLESAPEITKKHSYKDFEPVTIFGKVPSYLVTRADNPVNRLSLLASNPDKKISIGYGTETQEVLAKTLAKTLGGDVVVVPYKNTGDVMRELLGGSIDYAISTYTSSGPFIKQGKMVALATTATGTDVPEFGPKLNPLGKDFGAIIGLVLPKGTPKHIVDYYVGMSKSFLKDYASKFEEIQMIPATTQFGPAEFVKDMQALDAATK
jgi:tripartite-type tricarboxylate transporter receptor subunit TctC